MRILVTGGNGFVGQNLVKQLLKDNHEITITATSKTNLNVHKVLFPSFEGIDWKYVCNQDVVFHQMAINDTQFQDRTEMLRANLCGPMKLFNLALKGGCKKFIYASSTAVYGNSPAPYTEETPTQPLTPYAESKLKFDEFAKTFAADNDVLVVGLRYCNVYGPGEEHKGSMMSQVGQILKAMLKQQSPRLFEFGEQKRDWVYIKDVINANMLAMNAKESGVYNIGSGNSWTFNEIVNFADKAICEKKGIQNSFFCREWGLPTYIKCPFTSSYQSYTECDITKARKNFEYNPRYNLETGINEYLDHFFAQTQL